MLFDNLNSTLKVKDFYINVEKTWDFAFKYFLSSSYEG